MGLRAAPKNSLGLCWNEGMDLFNSASMIPTMIRTFPLFPDPGQGEGLGVQDLVVLCAVYGDAADWL